MAGESWCSEVTCVTGLLFMRQQWELKAHWMQLLKRRAVNRGKEARLPLVLVLSDNMPTCTVHNYLTFSVELRRSLGTEGSMRRARNLKLWRAPGVGSQQHGMEPQCQPGIEHDGTGPQTVRWQHSRAPENQEEQISMQGN